jgi:single-stranded-DNA-specific exonuclease
LAPPSALTSVVGGHPLVATALQRRGFADPASALAFLDPGRYRPAPAAALPGVTEAAEIILRAIRAGERICIWGDFDVDGQTATAILVEAVRDLGGAVGWHVPIREIESHGVGLAPLKRVLDTGVGLVVTCDTGIAAHEAAEVAKSRRVPFVVTDHHDLPPFLPEAAAVVSPKLLDPAHPLRDLPGAGVAYLLSTVLREVAGLAPSGAGLDLLALGIVADLAVQRRDTRYLLQRGLEALRINRRLGLRVLLEANSIDPAGIDEEHIGFVIAPRLNAAGRLGDANPCIELLTTTDDARARIISADLEGLNARRKLLCDQVEQGAEALIARRPDLLEPPVLVLGHPTWPPGVIGIVASRLVDRYGRPAVLIATPDGAPARGSARSVPGFPISEAIAGVSEMLLSHGGHPMAAGLSMDGDRLDDFRAALNRYARIRLPAVLPTAPVAPDGELPLGELSQGLASDLGRLGPFGPGNPPLLLVARDLQVARKRSLGRNRDHLLVKVADATGATAEAILWNGGGEPLPQGRFDLAFILRSSSYAGEPEFRLEWVSARASAGQPPDRTWRDVPDVIDLRAAGDPVAEIEAVAGDAGVIVWGEGEASVALGLAPRTKLVPARVLVIATPPPDPGTLRAALERVAPERVILLALSPGGASLRAFLVRLAGAARFALREREGQVAVAELAAACAQSEAAVALGLAWLEADGQFVAASQEGDQALLQPGRKQRDLERRDTIGRRLAPVLAETAAYRRYYLATASEALLRSGKLVR